MNTEIPYKGTLAIGLVNSGFGLEAALKSAGVCFNRPKTGEISNETFKTIILGSRSRVPQQLHAALEAFVQNGGLLLETGHRPVVYTAGPIHRKKISYLINKQQHAGFDRIGFIDIYSVCSFTNNTKAYFGGLIDFQSVGKGFVGRIGLDMDALWLSSVYRRKRFLSSNGPAPDELASSFDRTRAVTLLETTLLELHIRAELPLITKWHSPVKKPVFAFRIDTDYGTQESLSALYKLAVQYTLNLTWFLHAKAHEAWLDYFRTFEHQELALHCYRHGTSRSADKIKADLKQAMKVLEYAEINTRGYAAPYGILTKGHKKTLCTFERLYSSDFTAGYDGRPFDLSQEENGAKILQIPVHPVCTGSLSRRHYTEEAMSAYFNRVIDEKTALFEPVLLYHHPLQPGLNAVENIFRRVNHETLHNLTFTEFADFWKKRDTFRFEAWANNGMLTLKTAEKNPFLLKYALNHAGFSLVSAGEHQISRITNNEYTYGAIPVQHTEEVKALHGNRLHLWKTSLLDYKNRKRL